MAVEASIVVEFGESAAEDSETVIVELDPDHDNNLNDAGELKSSFLAGEQPVIIIHHSSNLRIDKVLCTDGEINLMGGNLIKRKDKEVLFTTTETENSIGYFNASLVSQEWFGNIGIVAIEDDDAVLNSELIPCLGHIYFDVVFAAQYILTPPSSLDDLIGDETYKIVIVIYMESI